MEMTLPWLAIISVLPWPYHCTQPITVGIDTNLSEGMGPFWMSIYVRSALRLVISCVAHVRQFFITPEILSFPVVLQFSTALAFEMLGPLGISPPWCVRACIVAWAMIRAITFKMRCQKLVVEPDFLHSVKLGDFANHHLDLFLMLTTWHQIFSITFQHLLLHVFIDVFTTL